MLHYGQSYRCCTLSAAVRSRMVPVVALLTVCCYKWYTIVISRYQELHRCQQCYCELLKGGAKEISKPNSVHMLDSITLHTTLRSQSTLKMCVITNWNSNSRTRSR